MSAGRISFSRYRAGVGAAGCVISSELAVQSARIRANASAFWTAVVTAAVLSASAWLREPSVQYLALGTTATVAAAVLTFRHGQRMGWRWMTVAALALADIVAVPPQIELRQIDAHWEQWRGGAGQRRLDAMRAALEAKLVHARPCDEGC